MPQQKYIELQVEGMTCSHCAMTVQKYLENQHMQDVHVNFASGEVRFGYAENPDMEQLSKGIRNLGYQVVQVQADHTEKPAGSTPLEKRFWFCAAFTLPLLLHMFLPWHLLHQAWFQLLVSLPVYALGIPFFGRNAWFSIRNKMPNMDVLIFTGASASFCYSLLGMFLYNAAEQYLFFETGATIITLVLLGNLIEQRSVKRTTSTIRDLHALTPAMATRILATNQNGTETFEQVACDTIAVGEVLLVRTGEKIPVDGFVLQGNGTADESMLTGESLPLQKEKNSQLLGGSLLTDGNIRMQATAVGRETTLARIIELVKTAQASKPAIQKLGDQVSVYFVQVVMGIALLTFLVGWLFFHIPLQDALMRAIAVLVISCPCAMGLATPTAVMVGLGMGARNGILIKGGASIEELARLQVMIFDKTGTLTTGNFLVKEVVSFGISEVEAKNILYHLEQHSSHPIARSIAKLSEWKTELLDIVTVNEQKGIGVFALDAKDNAYALGSYKIAETCTKDDTYDLYLLRNNRLTAALRLMDDLKPGAAETISYFRSKGIRTIMLSGDQERKCAEVAGLLNMDEYHSAQMPQQKLQKIEALRSRFHVGMTGDGINDGPSLAKAHVGISMANASDLARQSAQVLLLGKDLNELVKAHRLGLITYSTIKQNLFWALAYNVVAIPVAAMGLLSPMLGALSMAFSDVVVIGNSLRLRTRKL